MQDKSFGIVPIYKKSGEYLFLLVQQNAGHWAFPKGHAERGESDIEAARRELWEETGIKEVEVVPQIFFTERYVFSFLGKFLPFPKFRFTRFMKGGIRVFKSVVYFIGFVKNNTVQISQEEIRDYKWLNYEKALRLLTFPAGRRVLNEVHKYIQTVQH